MLFTPIKAFFAVLFSILCGRTWQLKFFALHAKWTLNHIAQTTNRSAVNAFTLSLIFRQIEKSPAKVCCGNIFARGKKRKKQRHQKLLISRRETTPIKEANHFYFVVVDSARVSLIGPTDVYTLCLFQLKMRVTSTYAIFLCVHDPWHKQQRRLFR